MNAPELSAVKNYFDIAVAVLAIGNMIWNWMISRSMANKKAIDGIRDAHSELADRLTKVEGHIDHAPTHNDLAKIYEYMREVAEDVNKMSGYMEGLSRSMDRVENKLLNEGKR